MEIPLGISSAVGRSDGGYAAMVGGVASMALPEGPVSEVWEWKR